MIESQLSGQIRQFRTADRSSTHLPVKLPEIVDEQIRHLHRREVTALGHSLPVDDVVDFLGPRSRYFDDLRGIPGMTRRDVDILERESVEIRLVVQPHRRVDRFRQPVDAKVIEQSNALETLLEVGTAVAPRVKPSIHPARPAGESVSPYAAV